MSESRELTAVHMPCALIEAVDHAVSQGAAPTREVFLIAAVEHWLATSGFAPEAEREDEDVEWAPLDQDEPRVVLVENEDVPRGDEIDEAFELMSDHAASGSIGPANASLSGEVRPADGPTAAAAPDPPENPFDEDFTVSEWDFSVDEGR